MRSQLAFTMDSMYGRGGTSSAYRYSCQKEYPKFSLTGMRGQKGGNCDAHMAAARR